LLYDTYGNKVEVIWRMVLDMETSQIHKYVH